MLLSQIQDLSNVHDMMIGLVSSDPHFLMNNMLYNSCFLIPPHTLLYYF
jgi:hypothetical protein